MPYDRRGRRLCGARCRDGHVCRAKARNNGRCRMHGGLSTGPKTQKGRARVSAAIKKAWAEHRDERRARISAGLQRYWASMKKSP